MTMKKRFALCPEVREQECEAYDGGYKHAQIFWSCLFLIVRFITHRIDFTETVFLHCANCDNHVLRIAINDNERRQKRNEGELTCTHKRIEERIILNG